MTRGKCTLATDGDQLEKHHEKLISDRIPEYVRFWEEYIGARRTPRGLKPYRLLPQSKVTEKDIDWHLKVCLAHYSFVHNWLEARHHADEVGELCSQPDIEDLHWRESHLRAFECCMMRVGNARDMIGALRDLLAPFRDSDVAGAHSEALTTLDRMIAARDGIVHIGIPRMELSDAAGRAGQPLMEYIPEDKHRGRGPRAASDREWVQTSVFCQAALDALTDAFNESNRLRYEEFRKALQSKSLRMEWKGTDEI